MTYQDKIDILRQKKEAQTQEKLRRNGYMDEDDYGSVPPPEDFVFNTEFNDPVNRTFYGAKLWASNFTRLLRAHPLYVDPYDALAGRWMFILQRLRPFESVVSSANLEMAPIFNFDELKPYHEKYNIIPGIGKMHHFAGDYKIGLSLGWKGLLEKVRKYRDINKGKEEFYNAEEEVILAIENFISRTAAEVRRLEALEENPDLKENLSKMAEVNEWVIENPPRSFREACQWIAWLNMCDRTYNRAGAGTQLDSLLLPYYERDKQAGIIDAAEAQYIIACLLINDPHYYQIAGPDSDGKDMTSELSFIILEAAHMVKSSVNLTIRVHDGLDEKLFRRSLEILFEDRKGCPRYSGDKALVEGFMKNGYPASLARKRIAVGCHWMSLPGLEYTMNDLIKINLAKVFEVSYDEYASSEGEKNVEGLYKVYLKHLKIAVDVVAKGIDFHLENQYKNAPELLLNLMCYGPIEKGLDASHGGVEYYNIGVDGAGLATAADSFAAIKRRIEDEKRLSWDELTSALHSGFDEAVGERIRLMLRSSPHFGEGMSLGDEWAERISSDFTSLVTSRRTPGGRIMIPGLFSWANTVSMGKEVRATPNGRKAHAPIAHGANPDPGFRKDGAFTAAATAIARVQPGYGNTAPFQLELNPTITDSKIALDVIGAVIKTHFALGGTLVNINIIDKDTILAAHANPQAFPDLVVRVTGFTAYFATLSPEFRQLVVDRIINDR